MRWTRFTPSGDPAAGDGSLTQTIRDVGAVSRALSRATPGDVVGARGPFGTSWGLDAAVGHDLVIVAGGVGLAPLRPVVPEAPPVLPVPPPTAPTEEPETVPPLLPPTAAPVPPPPGRLPVVPDPCAVPPGFAELAAAVTRAPPFAA